LTIGFQWGGQAYSEFIFFENEDALEHFKQGNYELGAQASAVAVTAGASADANYSSGVAVFTQAKGGLMYEASVGGQKFKVEAQ
jgi:lipid-binding SYLF domain-containing protein